MESYTAAQIANFADVDLFDMIRKFQNTTLGPRGLPAEYEKLVARGLEYLAVQTNGARATDLTTMAELNTHLRTKAEYILDNLDIETKGDLVDKIVYLHTNSKDNGTTRSLTMSRGFVESALVTKGEYARFLPASDVILLRSLSLAYEEITVALSVHIAYAVVLAMLKAEADGEDEPMGNTPFGTNTNARAVPAGNLDNEGLTKHLRDIIRRAITLERLRIAQLPTGDSTNYNVASSFTSSTSGFLHTSVNPAPAPPVRPRASVSAARAKRFTFSVVYTPQVIVKTNSRRAYRDYRRVPRATRRFVELPVAPAAAPAPAQPAVQRPVRRRLVRLRDDHQGTPQCIINLMNGDLGLTTPTTPSPMTFSPPLSPPATPTFPQQSFKAESTEAFARVIRM